MIPQYVEYNGIQGRPVSIATLAILQMTGNRFASSGSPEIVDVMAFLFVHFSQDWKLISRLASKCQATGSSEEWVAAIFDWAQSGGMPALEGDTIERAFEMAGEMAAKPFRKRVEVVDDGAGGAVGKSQETTQGGSPALSSPSQM